TLTAFASWIVMGSLLKKIPGLGKGSRGSRGRASARQGTGIAGRAPREEEPGGGYLPAGKSCYADYAQCAVIYHYYT
ncbi:MAG: hypothetical protein ACREXY_07820, partial [Gammaproteobacteria bacterium]